MENVSAIFKNKSKTILKTVILLLSSVPLYRYATICLFLHLLMTLQLFQFRGYYKQSCYKCSCTSVYMYI